MEDKLSGSYYTPTEVIQFMLDYLEAQNRNFNHILEPSAGDGRFIDYFVNEKRWEIEKLDAVELFEEKIKNMEEKKYPRQVHLISKDFLDYSLQEGPQYDLIIGNPPYINLKNMDDNSVIKAKKICEKADIDKRIMKNMWAAFVVGASLLLKEEGAIFFVLPMEFLQVQYAEKLRGYLEKHYNTIHIITFKERIFEHIEQETCLLYMANEKKAIPYISYKEFKSTSARKALRKSKIEKNKPLAKWSNAVLDDVDILFLKEISNRYIEIGKMGLTAPGIVTGGNSYFIKNAEFIKEMGAERFALPIIQKGQQIKETIYLNDAVFQELSDRGENVYLLNLVSSKKDELSKRLIEYLDEIGEEKKKEIKLKERYKCRNREPWYGIPIVKCGQVVFFKRYGILPKVLINHKEVHTTDSGYHMFLSEQYDKENTVFCFYNSLTLALCEFNGRYYGGGVAELIPSEFKNLRIPYRQIDEESLRMLEELISRNASVEEITALVNEKTICQDISKEEVIRLDRIRKRLMERRLGANR